jgi:Bacterial Ig-like domain
VLSTRHAPRSSTVHLRAFVAAALALGLVLAISAVASAAPAVTIDSGPSGSTNDTTPTFTFTVDPSATTVECSIDQGLAVYVPCADAYTPALPLAEGDWTFRVHASDGVEDTFRTQDFTVDTTPPSVSIDSGPSGATNDTSPSFGFTAGGDATAVECSIDQGSPSYAPCAGTFAPGAPLAEGSYTFSVQVTDAAGNQATATRSFTVDTTPPSLSIDSGPSGPTNDRTPSFGFTAEPGATTECSVDQGSPSYTSCTSPYTPAALADGSYTFHVRATDAAGNQTEASRSFSVDTVAPAVGGISGPAITSDPTPSFSFSAEAGATVQCSIDQGSAAYASCTSPYVSASLPDGRYTFRVRATDAAGNTASASQAFTVDSGAPSLSIDSGPSGPTNDTTPTFAFTAEAGTTVECSLDHGTPAYGPCTSATTLVVGAPLAEGRYVFRVRATDGADNQAIATSAFTVDTRPPSLSIGFGPSGTTSDSTPLFGFTAEAGATVACSIDQGTPAYGPCTSATAHAADAPLADGAYVFRVRATDAAGNQTTATRAFTVDTGQPAPTPASPTPDPAPTTPAPTPAPPKPQLLSPFPLVRISGTLTSTGARIRLLAVRAPRGALVRVTVSPACGKQRHASRRCRVLRASGTVGRHAVIDFRSLARAYRSGTVIVVRVSRADRIGKYTRFTIVRGKAPRRVDQCLMPGATRGSRCPSD